METVFFRVRIIRSLTEVHRRFRGTSFLYFKCILTSHPATLIIVLSYSFQFFISVLCLYALHFYSVISLTLLAHLKPKSLTVLWTVFFPHFFFFIFYFLFFCLPRELAQPHLPRLCAPSFYNYPDDGVSSFF